MSGKLIRPYEISVWEEQVTANGMIETKLAVIGSDTMMGYNKIYNPVFHKKVNGEKTLSFSLRYKYFDPFSGADGVVNPFAALLVNERKVKLYYQNEWYEFIIKNHTESSDGLEWTYTCTDAYVLELSKIGYNITFDAELNNNQGTARELAVKTLENTDWQVGESDTLKQYVDEPIYKAVLHNKDKVTIINASKDKTSLPDDNPDIYLFYSYVKNQDGKYVQFIIRDKNRKYVIDDKKVITDTNFRIITELEFKNNKFVIKGTNTEIITFTEVDTRFQANRLAYNQLTTYDPVMQRTVDRFKATNGDLEVYRYADYTYTTSNVVMNYITNGENFNALEDGTLQGWNPYTDQSTGDVKKLELITEPPLATGKPLANLNTLSQVEGFLKVEFNGAKSESGGKVYNTVYNSGIRNNISTIQSISRGQEFVFRWRAAKGGTSSSQATQKLGLIVAKYTQDEPTRYGLYYKHINPNDIILKLEGVPTAGLDNYITGGTISNNSYVIDGVAQTPSTKYIYKVGSKDYVWNGQKFVEKDGTNYLPYYYIKGPAIKSVSSAELSDPTINIGIFIYNTEGAGTFYIQDIQLTPFIPDSNEKPLIVGNLPTAVSDPTEYYYKKPADGAAAEDIETYTSLDALKQDLGITETTIEPLYNTNSEKNLTISASQSNCFNILQTIAETFECWVDLKVEHDSNGYIKKTNGVPNKYVYLREYVGKDNYAGFKYGINLQSIERTVESEEFVTKLIVDSAQSDYVDEGYVSITNAPSNQSGESYIYNFNYYYQQNLLDREATEQARIAHLKNIANLNKQIKAKEKEKADLQAKFTTLNSNRNVYTELVNTAREDKSEALTQFKSLAKMSYEDYQKIHTDKEPKDQLTEDDTLYELLGKLYTDSAAINNYGGFVTITEQQYWEVKNKLEGVHNYKIKIWVGRDNNSQRHVFVELSDYLPGVKVTVGGVTETSTVSKKYFDFTTDARQVTFTAPSGYTIPGSPYTVDDKKVARLEIKSDKTTPSIQDEIDKLIATKQEAINEFENKYSRFILEGTWNSTEYIDSELYYLDALQVSNTSAEPIVSYNINVVEIGVLEDFKHYTFDTGDKTYIEDTEFFGWHADNIGTEAEPNYVVRPAREEVIVSEIEWHLEEPENSVITVRNYKTRFEDLFQRISAAVQTVQYNEATYAKTSTLLDADGTLNQNVLLDALQKLGGAERPLTTDGSIIIHGDEILIQNLTKQENRVILNSEGIRISSDGGNSWKTAIDGQGINVDAVYTGTLNTNQIIIGSSTNPSFRWDKNGISAYQSNGTEPVYIACGDTETRIVPDTIYYTYNETTQTYERVSNPTGNPYAQHYYRLETPYNLQTFVRYDQWGLYGIKNSGSFKAQNINDIKLKAHFAITWDGFFIKNSYSHGNNTYGRVSITSDNDFRITTEDYAGNLIHEKIKIGALEWKRAGWQPGDIIYTDPATVPKEIKALGPSLYGIRINNNAGETVFKTGDDGNIKIIGTIDARGGNFSEEVTVGKNNNSTDNDGIPWIIIDGVSSKIKSSNYRDGAGAGWMINKDGDAYFNNITARGAIKTAVFEYAEIQAVGGIFLFRPSSRIKGAEVIGNDLVVEVEKPLLFAKIRYYESTDEAVVSGKTYYQKTNFGYEEVKNPTGNPKTQHYYEKEQNNRDSWCKISNYTSDGAAPESTVESILLTNGLTHVYQVGDINGRKVTLLGGKAFIDAIKDKSLEEEKAIAAVLKELEGGALVDMGREDGSTNYGIGVNSSDNTVNLPRRAISLFETTINPDPNVSTRVTYEYRGILGTLPELSATDVDDKIYNRYMSGTQGIYTDNMYIGDATQYIAFYRQNNTKHLKIRARDLVYDVVNDQEIPWDTHIEDIAGQGTSVIVYSSFGAETSEDDTIGCIFARVVRNGQDLTPINKNLRFLTSAPTASQTGEQYVQLNVSSGLAQLKQWNGSAWVNVIYPCSFDWTFKDEGGNIVNKPIQNNNKKLNQFILINAKEIGEKVIAEVEVTLD